MTGVWVGLLVVLVTLERTLALVHWVVRWQGRRVEKRLEEAKEEARAAQRRVTSASLEQLYFDYLKRKRALLRSLYRGEPSASSDPLGDLERAFQAEYAKRTAEALDRQIMGSSPTEVVGKLEAELEAEALKRLVQEAGGRW